MAWLAQRWANIVHPTDNHTPKVRLNANVGPTLSCYLGTSTLVELSFSCHMLSHLFRSYELQGEYFYGPTLQKITDSIWFHSKQKRNAS